MGKFKDGVSFGRIIRNPYVIWATILILCLVPQMPFVLMFPLAFYALLGTGQALRVLSIVFVIKMLNPELYSSMDIDKSNVLIMGHIILAIAFFRVLFDTLRARLRPPRCLLYAYLFTIFVAISSMLTSIYPLISILKITYFSVGLNTVLLGFWNTKTTRSEWLEWFFAMYVVIFSFSSLFVFNDIGYFRNGRGFQGILNQPQTYGIFIAPFVVWVTSRVFFVRRRLLLVSLLALCLWGHLFLTQARVSLVSTVVGLLAALFFSVILDRRNIYTVRKWLLRPLSFSAICVSAALLVLFHAQAYDSLSGFVRKGVDGTGVANSFMSSRGNIAMGSFNNFLESPYIGYGFGIGRSRFNIEYSSSGIPISAPSEKGIIITAILEETGIVGALIFVIFMLSIIRIIVDRNDFMIIWMVFTALATNIGEATLFSFNGYGMIIWLLVGVSLTMDSESTSQENASSVSVIEHKEVVLHST